MDKLSDMARIYTNYLETRLNHFGLRNGQASIITALGLNGPSSQVELAQFRRVTAATISIMLGRMERDGYVVRSGGLGKNHMVSLTEKGRLAHEQLSGYMRGEAALVLRGLTDEDKQAAVRIFSVISDNLANYNVKPPC